MKKQTLAYLILLSFFTACGNQKSLEVTKIYEGEDGSSIYFDREKEREKLLVRNNKYLFTILQKSGNNNWLIAEKTPIFADEGKIETEHILFYVPEARHIDFTFASELFSPFPLFLETINGEDFLLLTYNNDPEKTAGFSLANITATHLTGKISETIAHSKSNTAFPPDLFSIRWPRDDIFPKMAATDTASFMLLKDGTLRCWGNNESGLLGNGENIDSNVPVSVSLISGIRKIDGGSAFVLALLQDGSVWAWGENKYGELGNGGNEGSNVPARIPLPEKIQDISGGCCFALALKADGTVWAWGQNSRGQLGNGTTEDSSIPVKVHGLSDITAIAGGREHSLALKADGTVWAWGRNEAGQLGDGTFVDRLTAVQVLSPDGEKPLSGIKKISAGGSYAGNSAAISEDGTLYLWGDNDNGQLADGTKEKKARPGKIDSLSRIISVSIGGQHILALREDRKLWAWGYNWDGQAGDGSDDEEKLYPVQVSYLSDIEAIETKGNHSFAVDSRGIVWGWGNNYHGQLGDGTTGGIQKTPEPLIKK